MNSFEQVFDDDDLLQPEELAPAADWGWMSPGAHSWRPVIVASVLFAAVLILALLK